MINLSDVFRGINNTNKDAQTPNAGQPQGQKVADQGVIKTTQTPVEQTVSMPEINAGPVTSPVSEDEKLVNIDLIAKIKVIGVGGGGNNTIHSMIKEGIKGVDFIAANTDEQALNASISPKILPLGKNATKGLGAGARPDEGRKAALESESAIREILKDSNMVIIAAGMGGGTGTGAAPVVAKIAKELGALTIAVVTTPFKFEGTQRRLNAEEGLRNLYESVDSLIVVSNDKLLKQFGSISLKDSFLYADHVLKQSVRSITDLISVPALINLDFADVTTVMKNKGRALIGIGRASGEDRATKASHIAIASPILEASINGATHAIINISGSDITLDEAERAVSIIRDSASPEVNIIFGVSIDESLGDEIQVSVIATGLLDHANEALNKETPKVTTSQPQAQVTAQPKPAPRETVAYNQPANPYQNRAYSERQYQEAREPRREENPYRQPVERQDRPERTYESREVRRDEPVYSQPTQRPRNDVSQAARDLEMQYVNKAIKTSRYEEEVETDYEAPRQERRRYEEVEANPYESEVRNRARYEEEPRKVEVLKESSPKVEVRKTKESTLEFKINFNHLNKNGTKSVDESDEAEHFFAKHPVEAVEAELTNNFRPNQAEVEAPSRSNYRDKEATRHQNTEPFGVLDDEEDDLPAFLR